MDAHQYFRVPPLTLEPPAVGASPWVYTNTSGHIHLVTVLGGAGTSLIELNVGLGFVLTGLLIGEFELQPGQSIRITYLVTAPVVAVVQL